MGSEQPEKDIYRAEFNPEDALASVNYLLGEFSFDEIPFIDRNEHRRLEESEDPDDKALLKKFEQNAHRMNFWHKFYAVFDDVHELLPVSADYFRGRLKELNARYVESGVASSSEQKPIPHDLVIEMKGILEEYRNTLQKVEQVDRAA